MKVTRQRLLVIGLLLCITLPLILIPPKVVEDYCKELVISKARQAGVFLSISELSLGLSKIELKDLLFTIKGYPVAGKISRLEIHPEFLGLFMGRVNAQILGDIFGGSMNIAFTAPFSGSEFNMKGGISAMGVNNLPLLKSLDFSSGTISLEGIEMTKSAQSINILGTLTITQVIKSTDTSTRLGANYVFVPKFDISHGSGNFTLEGQELRISNANISSSFGSIQGSASGEIVRGGRSICDLTFTPSQEFERRFSSFLPLVIKGDTTSRPLNLQCAGTIGRTTLTAS